MTNLLTTLTQAVTARMSTSTAETTSPKATQAADIDPAVAMTAVNHIYNVTHGFYQVDEAMWGMRSKNYLADVVTHILLLCAELPVLLKFDMLQGAIDWHALRGVLTAMRQSLRFCVMTPAPQTVQIPTSTATLSAEHGVMPSTGFHTLQAKVYQKIDIMRTAVKDSIVKQLEVITHHDLAMRIGVLAQVCFNAASTQPLPEDQLTAFNVLSGMWRDMGLSLSSMLPVIYAAHQAGELSSRIVKQQLRMFNAAATAAAIPALGFEHPDQQSYLAEVRLLNRKLDTASAPSSSTSGRDGATRLIGSGAAGGHGNSSHQGPFPNNGKGVATCNNFNRGGCTKPGCAYRHQCSVCDSFGHNAVNHGGSRGSRPGASGDYNHYLRDSSGSRAGSGYQAPRHNHRDEHRGGYNRDERPRDNARPAANGTPRHDESRGSGGSDKK